MTPDRKDSGQVLPTMPESIPALGPSLAGLEVAGPTTAGSFLVEGERAFVVGAQRNGIRTISIDGVPVLTELDAGIGVAANIVLHPGVARREFMSSGGTCIETIVVAPAMPFVVIQWGVAGGPVPTEIRFELPHDGVDAEPEWNDSVLSIISEDDRLSVVGATPTPESITVSGRSRVRVVIRPREQGPFSLVVAAGAQATTKTALAASTHLPAHGRRAATGPREDGLRIVTGLSDLDEGIAWAGARLRGIIDRTVTSAHSKHAPAEESDAPLGLFTGFAAACAGDREGAERALSLDRPRTTAAGALLAARYAMTFGDASYALSYARAWIEATTTEPTSSSLDARLDAVAAPALADALRYAAPAPMIEQLRQTHRSAGRRLPVIGDARDVDTESARRYGIPVDGIEGRHGPLFRTDPDAAWIEWRNMISKGLSDGPAGPASWDSVDRVEGSVTGTITADILLTLTRGLLGLDPDAPVGRITIAPRLPSHLMRFSARGITLGDSTLSMEYERSAQVHRFTLVPEIAAVPPLVVFEPAVNGSIREVRVDGTIADLDVHSAGPMSVVRIQIPADATRTIEIVTA